MSTTEAPEAPEQAGEHAEQAGEHAEHPPDSTYIWVAVVLAVLTALEVATYFVDVGDVAVPALLLLMAVKFSIVAMFFMHLRYDTPMLSRVFVFGLILAVSVYIATLAAFEHFETFTG